MREIKIDLYKFDELSEQAKKVAIEEERQSYNQYVNPLFEFGYTIEEVCKDAGFNNVKAIYSFSSCQGDGLSFDCNEIDLDLYAAKATDDKAIQKLLIEHVKVWTESNNMRYTYPALSDVHTTVYSEDDLSEVKGYSEAFTKLELLIMRSYMDVCKKLEKMGYDEIEYQDKDETIIERINEDDEIEFKANGKRYTAED